jgi:rRNA maturation endonuclease Nob1
MMALILPVILLTIIVVAVVFGINKASKKKRDEKTAQNYRSEINNTSPDLFCTKCGAAVSQTDKFCQVCGKNLK